MTKWSNGDLVVDNQQKSALVLSVEQLMEEKENTEAFLITDDGEFRRVYPYQVGNRWSRLRDTEMSYRYTTRDQALVDFRKGYFNRFFA